MGAVAPRLEEGAYSFYSVARLHMLRTGLWLRVSRILLEYDQIVGP
jgi:hypothetical protein